MSMWNPSKILFLLMLIMGTLISISSNSWPATWMGLEINLLSFIPLMTSTKNMLSSEAAMKYFIIQAMASSMLLTMIFINYIIPMMNPEMMNSIIAMTLFMKMGSAPFHMWFPSVMEGLSWNNCIILMTWQKVAPFIILSYLNYNQAIIFVVMMLSIIVGSIGGLGQTSIRKIMAYSSINHMGWMILSLNMSENLFKIYFCVYAILSTGIMLIFKNMSSYHMNQITFNQNPSPIKFMMLINFLSLGGLPPFLGFLPKWMVIQTSFQYNLWFVTLAMILITLVTLFYYIRVATTSFLINSSMIKWNLSMHNSLNTTMISALSVISLFSLPLYTMLYFSL